MLLFCRRNQSLPTSAASASRSAACCLWWHCDELLTVWWDVYRVTALEGFCWSSPCVWGVIEVELRRRGFKVGDELFESQPSRDPLFTDWLSATTPNSSQPQEWYFEFDACHYLILFYQAYKRARSIASRRSSLFGEKLNSNHVIRYLTSQRQRPLLIPSPCEQST
jgi:hypothetical protein